MGRPVHFKLQILFVGCAKWKVRRRRRRNQNCSSAVAKPQLQANKRTTGLGYLMYSNVVSAIVLDAQYELRFQ